MELSLVLSWIEFRVFGEVRKKLEVLQIHKIVLKLIPKLLSIFLK
jgi:hypothetical protein